MPGKRPPPPLAATTAPAQPFRITDTLTLVIKGNNGSEVRVKDGVTTQQPQQDLCQPAPASRSAESVMDKIRFDDLEVLETLGAGSQGKVRKVRNRQTAELYALKSLGFCEDMESMRDVLQGELTRIQALKHPNIVSSLEGYFRSGKIYILMEYMDAGTMVSLMKHSGEGFPLDILSYVAKNLLTGLAHLHSQGVVHRDIKPANLLASTKGDVKISDFGVAKMFERKQEGDLQKTFGAVGSTPYMSPERIRNQPYTFPCDVWSAGLTIAECAIGEYPFSGLKNHIFELCQAIANLEVKIAWTPQLQQCNELISFVSSCMLPDDRRPTARELLSHPFIVDIGRNVTRATAGEWFTRYARKPAVESPETPGSATFKPGENEKVKGK